MIVKGTKRHHNDHMGRISFVSKQMSGLVDCINKGPVPRSDERRKKSAANQEKFGLGLV